MKSSAPTDVIIIGSGAGGAAAAYRLVRDGFNVLVVEKGAPLPHDGSTLDITRVVGRGEFLSKEAWIDGRGLPICPEEHFNVGGKTKWYGAAVLRFSEREFAAEAAYAARAWPFAYAELAPYYEEAEKLLSVRTFACEPDLKIILDRLHARDAAWTSEPLPMALSASILSHPNEAHHFDGFASAADLKGDAQVNFLRPISGRGNFTLRTGAEVTDLLATDAGPQRVDGVRLTSGEELRAKRILLAGGALHSPRLLARYVDGMGASRPRFQSGLIGRNLKKHVLTALISLSPGRKSDVLRKTMITTHRDFPHSTVQPLGFDAELIATLVPKIVPRFIAKQFGRYAYGFFLQTEDGSHPGNHVSELPGGVRVMDYDVARLPAAQREHRAFVRAFQLDLLKMGMPSFTQATGLNGTAHVNGTLITGTQPEGAVVDPHGAVFGIGGLYVVDGSILPRSSRVNPSLSIFAWGLRVADHIAREAPRSV